jgi:hypothetical protein
MKSRKISSCNIVGCKIIWELRMNCKDSIRMALAGCRAKLNHLLVPAYNALEHLLDIFHLISIHSLLKTVTA